MNETTSLDDDRFQKLIARFAEKKAGAIDADLMVAVYASQKVENLKLQLRLAERELDHAKRGLSHNDYDPIFEGWDRA